MANTIDILGDEMATDIIIDRSVTDFIDDLVTSIGSYAFHSCTSLTSVNFSEATGVNTYAFASCTNLTSVNLPKVTAIGQYAFYSCTSLTSVIFPKATVIAANAFASCTNLTDADFPLVTSIASSAFNSCRNLTTLILRSSTMATLGSTNAFTACPAIIYVPDELVDSYKSASNWSTYASRIKGISELPEEE